MVSGQIDNAVISAVPGGSTCDGGGLDVAVVIPAYNAEKFLRRAVETALNQTLPPREILVVDDGSKDGSAALAESFGGTVRCIRQVNGGAASARNNGIRQASAAWIAFLDADDYWYPHKLARQAEVVTAFPDLKWMASSYHFRDGGLLQRPGFGSWQHGREAKLLKLRYFEAAHRGLNIHTSGLLIRRQVFEDVGFFDPALRRGQDLDLWWRIALANPEIGYLEEPLYCFDADVNPHGNRTNIAGKVRALARTLERARDRSPQAEAEYLAFAKRHFLLRMAMIAIRRMDFPADELRGYMDTFRVPGWQRMLLSLPRKLPRSVAGKLEQLVWRGLHPVKMITCQENECTHASSPT